MGGDGVARTLFFAPRSRFAGARPPSVVKYSQIVARERERCALKRLAIDQVPTDVMEMIFIALFTTWPLATYLLRVSHAFATLAARVRRGLPSGEWWTGGFMPLMPPASIPLPDLLTSRYSRAFTSLGVNGAMRQDVEHILKVCALHCTSRVLNALCMHELLRTTQHSCVGHYAQHSRCVLPCRRVLGSPTLASSSCSPP